MADSNLETGSGSETDLSNLQGTPFEAIPIEGIATEEEIEKYEKDPLVAELQVYGIKIGRNELTTKESKAIKQEGRDQKTALIEKNIEKMRELVDTPTVSEQHIIEKFLSLIDKNGLIPMKHLRDATYGELEIYTISSIYTPNILGAVKAPIVKLKCVGKDISMYIPAKNLPKMWLNPTSYVYQLKPVGRLSDVREKRE